MTAKRLSKSSTVVLLDRCRLGDAGIGDEDVQTIAHDGADLLGELVWPVRRGEIGGDGIGAAAGLADFRDDRFCLLRAAAVMDKHLGAGLGEGHALARPMPREAPVTRAVFPESVVMACFLVIGY